MIEVAFLVILLAQAGLLFWLAWKQTKGARKALPFERRIKEAIDRLCQRGIIEIVG